MGYLKCREHKNKKHEIQDKWNYNITKYNVTGSVKSESVIILCYLCFIVCFLCCVSCNMCMQYCIYYTIWFYIWVLYRFYV